jgi:hypothetical protein
MFLTLLSGLGVMEADAEYDPETALKVREWAGDKYRQIHTSGHIMAT